jgi:hypothetical protein
MSLPVEIEKAAQEAYGVIENTVSRPFFFEKLAAAGIHPESAEEADAMWEAGLNLRAAYQQNQTQKQASARFASLTELNDLARGHTTTQGEKQAAFDDVAKIASEDADLARSFLTLRLAAAAAAYAEE